MQTRQIFAAALLTLTAVAAMSQELDPRNDRMFNHPSAATGYQGPAVATRQAQAKSGDAVAAPTQGTAAKSSVQPVTNAGSQKPVQKDVVGSANGAPSL